MEGLNTQFGKLNISTKTPQIVTEYSKKLLESMENKHITICDKMNEINRNRNARPLFRHEAHCIGDQNFFICSIRLNVDEYYDAIINWIINPTQTNVDEDEWSDEEGEIVCEELERVYKNLFPRIPYGEKDGSVWTVLVLKDGTKEDAQHPRRVMWFNYAYEGICCDYTGWIRYDDTLETGRFRSVSITSNNNMMMINLGYNNNVISNNIMKDGFKTYVHTTYLHTSTFTHFKSYATEQKFTYAQVFNHIWSINARFNTWYYLNALQNGRNI
jgi:hypothetical protein